MSVPDITSTTGGMGITSNFSAKIKAGENSPMSKVVQEKVKGLEAQESAIVEKFIKADEKKDEDLALGKKGKVAMQEFTRGWDPDGYGVMKTTVDYNTKSKEPKEMHTTTAGFPDTVVKSDVKWGKDGHIESLSEKRVRDDGLNTITEQVTLKHDNKKGIIFYEEKLSTEGREA